MKHSNRYNDASAKVDASKYYSFDDAIKVVKETATAKFDESIEVAVRLGVDPRKADQMVRGTVILPAGTGKDIKVCVIAKGEKEKEAQEAGADFVGGDDMVEKIQGGWFGFDVCIATPDMMGSVGKLGRVLGPRGLMPNPKVGTVTMDIAAAVKESKAGKIDFRVDKYGNVQVAVGKGSFSEEQLAQNVQAFLDQINRLKPATAKGIYLQNITISSTMGPGIKIDKATIGKAA